MARIISFNANGIRAAERKGFFNWLAQQKADVVCVQETKAQEPQLTADAFWPEGYHCYYFDAERKGYSGTALYSRREPETVHSGLGWDPCDSEGRWLQADFDGISVISLYLPSGTASAEAQAKKYAFMDRLMAHLQDLRKDGREYIVCGDWNIAHRQIDLKNWRSNQKNSGFLPEERAWLDELFDQAGWVDGFRQVNQNAEEYTWWSNRGQAWAKNVGWRIDYHMVTPGLSNAIKGAAIYREERFSDHAPLTLDYSFKL